MLTPNLHPVSRVVLKINVFGFNQKYKQPEIDE